MAKNANLAAAKDAKNDEFYTQLSDIQAELSHYSDKFQGKVVFCNCDDPFESNFAKYFLMNFNRLGLKELIATGYKTSPVLGNEIGTKGNPYVLRVTTTKQYLVGTQKDLDPRGAKYFLDTEANNLMQPLIGNVAVDEHGQPIIEAVKVPVLDKNGQPVLGKKGKPKMKTEKRVLYYEAGDFRSDMNIELLKQCDIVCTNPPFSLFREYVALLVSYNKQFLIIGNMNAITYKEIFPLIRDNRLWLGCRSLSQDMYFDIPNDYKTYLVNNKKEGSAYKIVNGNVMGRLASICWFTNLDHEKRHQMMPFDIGCTYHGYEEQYPKYDNYDAINVNKVNQIPCDYMGVIGVPISFLDKYCPEQFEIIGIAKRGAGDPMLKTKIYTKNDYANYSDLNAGPVLIKNGVPENTYPRILIKRSQD